MITNKESAEVLTQHGGKMTVLRCVTCRKGDLYQSTTTDYTEKCGYLFATDEVPVQKCTACKEMYFQPSEIDDPVHLSIAMKIIEIGVRTGEAFGFCRWALGYGIVSSTCDDKKTIMQLLGIQLDEAAYLVLENQRGNFPEEYWTKIIPLIEEKFATLAWKPNVDFVVM